MARWHGNASSKNTSTKYLLVIEWRKFLCVLVLDTVDTILTAGLCILYGDIDVDVKNGAQVGGAGAGAGGAGAGGAGGAGGADGGDSDHDDDGGGDGDGDGGGDIENSTNNEWNACPAPTLKPML